MKTKILGPLFFLGLAGTLAAQQATDTITATNYVDEVFLTGSRNKNRTVINSPVPVDVIDLQEVKEATGQHNLNQLLQFAAPSFNSNEQSGSDASDATDPATLRGLGPDQTLMLLNGKRYHQSSLVNLFGTKGRGNTGSDLNSIPSAAIKRIEILRDGASAQYGSDAIAGVINIILQDRSEGTVANVYSGVNVFSSPGDHDVVSENKWDGFTLDASINTGAKLGKNGGFANFTFEAMNRDRSIRNANPNKYFSNREKFGDARMLNLYYFGNIEVPISHNFKFYSQHGLSYRNTHAYAWTRFPDEDNNINEIYPNGFNPMENTKITDVTFNNGFRFNLDDWDFDVYNALGYNRFMYNIEGTLNATMGPMSPTNFDAGGHTLFENITGFNTVKQFPVLEGLSIALGSEYRHENFTIKPGEVASYAAYDVNGRLVTSSTPASDLVINPLTGDVRPAGSQGFPGFSEAVDKSRSNVSAYVDTELDITKNWMISGAGRFEHYNDFGSTLNGKFSTRYAFSPAFAFRGSVSSGFRAPSLAQKDFGLEFTNFIGGKLVTIVLAPNESDLANAVGIPKLKEEKSINGSVGFTFNASKFTASIDGYYIRIKNRIVLSGTFDQTDDKIGSILAARNVDQAQFFTNALDTRTKGVDIVMAYRDKLGAGDFMATLAGNYNDMEITKVNTTAQLAGKEDIYLSARERAFILASAPKTKINLGLNYKINRFTTNLQLVRFAKVTLLGYDSDVDYQIYQPRIVTDLSFGYDITKNVTWSLGSRNLFNRYPSLQPTAVDSGDTESGGIFDPVQMGFAGRQLFTNLIWRF